MPAVSVGDPCGIGPEILIRTWLEKSVPRDAVVFADAEVLAKTAQALGLDVPVATIASPGELEEGSINVIDDHLLDGGTWEPGTLSADAGRAAYEYIIRATRAVLDGQCEALVTLPVNKEAIRMTHPDFSGHTELIAGLCDAREVTMMLASEKLVVTHVSTHVSMSEAISRITIDRVSAVIRLTYDALLRLHSRTRVGHEVLRHPEVRLRRGEREKPVVAVAGLNPHAGEAGAFGSEEVEVITPAVQAARSSGIDARGPFPPDTVFHRAMRGEYDAVVCMYHDQGHIPMKLIDFDGAVNITLGLPITRTSVDHGTAFDIAGKGLASTTSFVRACAFAAGLAETGRNDHSP